MFNLKQTNFINLSDNLPIAFDTIYLSKILNISRSKAYCLLTHEHLPYYKLNRKIIIFKQNFLEWIENKTITSFSDLKIIKNLPKLFSPLVLQHTLNISKSKVYEIIKNYNLYGFIPGKKIIIQKENLIKMFLKVSYC